MLRKYTSLILTFILISTTLLSCKGSNSSAQNANLPYYSITSESISHERNYYMELDIRIPKITYSGVESDELIDSINEEISTKISGLISDAKATALDSYNSYIETARNNAQNEFNTKLEELDTKYDEVFKEADVNGLTGTEVVIDPNLHNKNIIVVETTKAIEEATKSNTIAASERPSFNKGERPNFSKGEFPARPKFASRSEADKDLTIDDYYRDVAETNRITLPSDRDLLRSYTPTKILCNFDVKCLDEDYISLFIEFSEIKTAPTVKRFFYNIDLHSKKIIGIKDVLGENYKTLCVNTINSAIEKMSEEEKTNLKSGYNIDEYITDDLAFFINNNHLTVIELDKFTLSPSYLEFQIIK